MSLREREGRKEGRITGKSVGGWPCFQLVLAVKCFIGKELSFLCGVGVLGLFAERGFAHVLRAAHTLRTRSVVGPVDRRDCVCKGCVGRCSRSASPGAEMPSQEPSRPTCPCFGGLQAGPVAAGVAGSQAVGSGRPVRSPPGPGPGSGLQASLTQVSGFPVVRGGAVQSSPETSSLFPALPWGR